MRKVILINLISLFLVVLTEYMENLNTLEERVKGLRLDYPGSHFVTNPDYYGEIVFKAGVTSNYKTPGIEENGSYPYTATGFAGSNIGIFPEIKVIQELDLIGGELLLRIDAKTGAVVNRWRYDEIKKKWVE